MMIGSARPNGKDAARPRILNIQDEGGITKTVQAAVAAVHQLLPEANCGVEPSSPPRRSTWRWNAEAPTAIRASRPTPRWASRPT